jgi:hypothetical protein
MTLVRDPALFPIVAMCALLLMTQAGATKRRLFPRHALCPVCRRTVAQCSYRRL